MSAPGGVDSVMSTDMLNLRNQGSGELKYDEMLLLGKSASVFVSNEPKLNKNENSKRQDRKGNPISRQDRK